MLGASMLHFKWLVSYVHCMLCSKISHLYRETSIFVELNWAVPSGQPKTICRLLKTMSMTLTDSSHIGERPLGCCAALVN